MAETATGNCPTVRRGRRSAANSRSHSRPRAISACTACAWWASPKERETALGDKSRRSRVLAESKNPIPLRPNSPELFILARARDEAHRFANRGRKKGREAPARFASELESIPGVVPRRQGAAHTLGSLQGIRDATDEQILAVPGVTKKQLSALRSWFAVTDAMKNQVTS